MKNLLSGQIIVSDKWESGDEIFPDPPTEQLSVLGKCLKNRPTFVGQRVPANAVKALEMYRQGRYIFNPTNNKNKEKLQVSILLRDALHADTYVRSKYLDEYANINFETFQEFQRVHGNHSVNQVSKFQSEWRKKNNNRTLLECERSLLLDDEDRRFVTQTRAAAGHVHDKIKKVLGRFSRKYCDDEQRLLDITRMFKKRRIDLSELSAIPAFTTATSGENADEFPAEINDEAGDL
jgi:hypothetical protein